MKQTKRQVEAKPLGNSVKRAPSQEPKNTDNFADQDSDVQLPEPSSPYSKATLSQRESISALSDYIEELISSLEPHLPSRLFNQVGEASESPVECNDEGRVPYYNEQYSRTVNAINQATLEIDRLSARIQWLRRNIVL